MIFEKKISILKNLEVATSYWKYFNREFRSNLFAEKFIQN